MLNHTEALTSGDLVLITCRNGDTYTARFIRSTLTDATVIVSRDGTERFEVREDAVTRLGDQFSASF